MNAAQLPVGRRGRALAAAIGLVGVLTIWLAILDPLIGLYRDRSDLLERQRELLSHMQAAAASLPNLTAAAESGSAQPEVVLLTGASDAIAAAGLQQVIQRIASDAGAPLSAVETLPAETEGRWHKIPLRITLTAPWPVLMQVLHGFEQADVRIMTDDVHFRSVALQARSGPIPIQASLVVFGFRAAS